MIETDPGRPQELDAITILLNEIVDYAGLYPPASLDLPTVMANYDRYRRSPHRWMLGRLIVPVDKLGEASELGKNYWQSDEGWKLSVLVPPPDAGLVAWMGALEKIEEFNRDHEGLAVVDAMETKAPTVLNFFAAATTTPLSISTFWEIAPSQDMKSILAPINQVGNDVHFAKIRTGGVEPAAIPSAALVATFLQECIRNEVAFKATAGLHHPLRGEFRLTYESDSATAPMHGFLNMFIAAAIAYCYSPAKNILEEILTSPKASDFEFSPESIRFRDYQLSTDQLAAARSKFAISFGSCSFDEPVQDLQKLGIIQASAAAS